MQGSTLFSFIYIFFKKIFRIESKELRGDGRRFNESFQKYLGNFDDFMKILERAIQEENKRTTNNDVDQFENSEEYDSESKHCHME